MAESKKLPDGPARQLVGKILDDKWRVLELIERPHGHSGGTYSVCYKVSQIKKDGEDSGEEEIRFMKAYDIVVYFEKDEEGDTLKQISRMNAQFEYEKELSTSCKNSYVTKVAYVAGSGEVKGDYRGLNIPVPYLVFEMADGDLHKFLDLNQDIETSWKFKSLHDIAVGLKQLHAIKIYHQDIKPSNILTYPTPSAYDNTKIGDLGRSVKLNSNCPHLEEKFWGDHTYVPPELSYSRPVMTPEERMMLTDHYLLGSMIVFYFYGFTYNSEFYKGLNEELKPRNTTLTYYEVKDYLVNRYDEMMTHLKSELSFNDEKINDRFFSLIGYLCHPDIGKRHRSKPSAVSLHQKFSLDTVVSDLQYLYQRSRYRLKK